MIELPVEKLSDRPMKPNCALDQTTISSARRERWVAQIAQAARNSSAKSRAETASSELAIGRSKPSAAAVCARSIGKDGAGQRRGAERRFVDPPPRVGKPRPVAPEHGGIGQHVVPEGHRLGRLQVGEAGHDRIGMGLGLVDQGRLQVLQVGVQAVDGVAHPEAQVRRDLVVARARGVQPAGRRADQFGEPRLDIHVYVFQRRAEFEAAALDLLKDRVEPLPDCRRIFLPI